MTGFGYNINGFGVSGGGVPPFNVSYAVVAGAGAGGSYSRSGGGGAGGLLSGEETVIIGTPYSLTIGAGGAYVNLGTGTNGSSSNFASIGATGGGGGGTFNGQGQNGGSGGGSYQSGLGLGIVGPPRQGYNGGVAAGSAGAGGGGGAGSTGFNGSGVSASSVGGNGGSPVQLSLKTHNTGYISGGGGGAGDVQGGSVYNSSGGRGGDARSFYASGSDLPAMPGIINTGGGGGGARRGETTVAGGSGVVFLVYPDNFLATFTSGVTYSTTSSGGYKKTRITAAGPSDTVTFG